jgi:F-type H+-transporting ATPase subunit b
MEETLHALGGLFLRSCPTIILLIVLYIYLKAVFFSPLDALMKTRRELTEGARSAANARLKLAERRAAEYEEKLREARSQVLHEQEEARKQWLAEQSAHVEQAKAKADELIARNRIEIHEQTEKAEWDLARQAETLAEEISAAILRRRPS